MTPAVLVRVRPCIDLRYLSVAAAADRARSVDDIADACDVSADDVRALLRLADGEQGRSTLWCHAKGCKSYLRRATAADALRAAFAAGWRHDWRARLLCASCDQTAKTTKKTTKRGSR